MAYINTKMAPRTIGTFMDELPLTAHAVLNTYNHVYILRLILNKCS